MVANSERILLQNKKINNNMNAFHELKTNWQLFLMALPGILFFAVFCYYPLNGLLIAFKDYNIKDGILGSPWAGLENFEFFFKSEYFIRTTFNTLYLNFLFIFTNVIVSVTLAILLNEISKVFLKKLFQSLLFLPYFLSWVVISVFVYNLFSESYGAINAILKSIEIPTISWYSKPEIWRGLLTFINTWQIAGYFIIIYLATIVSIDGEILEAVKIDGANKFQEIIHITIPCLIPTIIILILLQIGRIFFGNFDMIYNIVRDNGILLPVTDVIDTYVFRAMRVQGSFAMGTAVGIYQSILGVILVIVSNRIAKVYDKNAGLF